MLEAKSKSPVSDGDILLCAARRGTIDHNSSPHFILRSDNTSGEDSFVIAMYLEQHFAPHAIRLQGVEVWFMAGGVEKKIDSWKQLMLRIADVEDFYDTIVGFRLLLSPYFVLASIAFYRFGVTHAEDMLKEFDSTLKDVEVILLHSNQGG